MVRAHHHLFAGLLTLSAAQLASLPPFFSSFRPVYPAAKVVFLRCKYGWVTPPSIYCSLPWQVFITLSLIPDYSSNLIFFTLRSGQIRLLSYFQWTMFCLSSDLACFCLEHSSVHHPSHACTNSHTHFCLGNSYPSNVFQFWDPFLCDGFPGLPGQHYIFLWCVLKVFYASIVVCTPQYYNGMFNCSLTRVCASWKQNWLMSCSLFYPQHLVQCLA